METDLRWKDFGPEAMPFDVSLMIFGGFKILLKGE